MNRVVVIEEKRAAPPLRANPTDAVEIVWAALPIRPRAGASLSELAAITGLTKTTVNGALYRLRQRGRLTSAVMPVAGREYHSRAPQWYWRAGDAA